MALKSGFVYFLDFDFVALMELIVNQLKTRSKFPVSAYVPYAIDHVDNWIGVGTHEVIPLVLTSTTTNSRNQITSMGRSTTKSVARVYADVNGRLGASWYEYGALSLSYFQFRSLQQYVFDRQSSGPVGISRSLWNCTKGWERKVLWGEFRIYLMTDGINPERCIRSLRESTS